MRVRLIWIGKTKDASLSALINEYSKRLSKFARCEVTELSAARARSPREIVAEEGRRICDALRADALVVLLNVEGRQWSSHELAAEVQRWQNTGTKEVAFVIGGTYGVSKDVSARANIEWSLSRLTLTHEMARVVLLEQIYRAYTIIQGLPYQK
jgi:23S rRNA (pseudouridine1915-N3)-methyltransferase